MTYNGYKNWETWNCVLWLQNDERSYRQAMDLAHMDTERAADNLRELFANNIPDIPPSWFYDVILGAIDSVAWEEVAAAFLDE